MSTEDTSAPFDELPFDAYAFDAADSDEVVLETMPAVTRQTVEWVDPHTLRPHPRNREVYGDMAPPSDLLDSISHGWIASSILEALPDGTLITGHLRRFAAIHLHLAQVPVIYREDLTDDESAQVAELLRNNAGRLKTREIICREYRLAFQTFKAEQGSVSGEKSRDVVGKRFGVSGVSLEHGIAVVNALDGRALDVEAKDKVRQALNQRGIEPAWKLLRRQDAAESSSDEAETEEGPPLEDLAISPARRQKALLDVLALVEAKEPILSALEATALSVPREDLDDVMARIQNTLTLLGLIEGELRDRIEGGRRAARKARRKSGV